MLGQELSTGPRQALSSALGQVRVTLSGLSVEEERTETASVATGCHSDASPEAKKCTPRTRASWIAAICFQCRRPLVSNFRGVSFTPSTHSKAETFNPLTTGDT